MIPSHAAGLNQVLCRNAAAHQPFLWYQRLVTLRADQIGESMDVSPAHPDIDRALGRARELLAEQFGHQDLLPGQEEALRSVLSERNLLVVMPTGSGKSLLYQLPALMEQGLTLVVSPLIALMKDQVDELARKGIPASFVNSSLSFEEQQRRLQQCAAGETKLLYVAPERFRNAAFLRTLDQVSVARMAVDEAHCISEWGHDFRPDYRRLQSFRERMGMPLVSAFTATATVRVQKDIVESLGLAPDEVDVHVRGFDRPNLVLRVVDASTDDEKDQFLLRLLKEHDGPGIIYAGTRNATESLAQRLKAVERSAIAYHAGLEPQDRAAAQDAFLTGKARVVVATLAFGMGIDKRDVRFVVHYNYPGSVEQYYQEIGRAGRDGLESQCVLLYSGGDRFLREFFIDLNYPTPADVEAVYDALWAIEDNPIMLTYREIADRCDGDIKEGQVGAAVRLFDAAGVTRALSGQPMIGLTLPRPAADILEQVRGPVQRGVLEALSFAIDAEVPGRYEISLWQLSAASGLAEEQVRRALSTMDREGTIGYEPPFRGRGIEKLVDPPPAFDQVPIDWQRQMMLRRAEEEKLAAMEGYIHSRTCRRREILRYFGEDAPLQCGTCDRCETGVPDGRESSDVLADSPEVALPVLVCVKHLRFPIGKGRIAQVVTGSQGKELIQWRLNRNPAYGRASASQDVVKEVIDDLVRAGLLLREGERGRPVLALTELGEEAIEDIDLDEIIAPMAVPQRAPAARAPTASDESIRSAVLRCVASLATPFGAGKVASIITGSKAKWVEPSGAAELDVYGILSDSAERVREVIGSMLEDGLLCQGGDSRYPVLGLTGAGRAALESTAAPMAEATEPAANRPVADALPGDEPVSPAFAPAAGNPTEALDAMVRQLLEAEPDEAKAILPQLHLFHPREVVRRLEASFEASQSQRVQARAVWGAGELREPHAIPFLIRGACSDNANVRRLAASALGKVAKAVRPDSAAAAEAMADMRGVLSGLLEDPVEQVAQYARVSLCEIPDVTE